MRCWSRRRPVAGMKLEQGSAGMVSWRGMSGHTMTCTWQVALASKGPHIHHHLTWAGLGDSAALWLRGRLAALYNCARLHQAEGRGQQQPWPCTRGLVPINYLPIDVPLPPPWTPVPLPLSTAGRCGRWPRAACSCPWSHSLSLAGLSILGGQPWPAGPVSPRGCT